MDYNEIKTLMDAAENPTTKAIYANHLRRLEGKKADCSACPPETVITGKYKPSKVKHEEEE